MRTLRVLFVALAITGCAGIRDTVQLSSAVEPLRLSRVVLYENGLAHFERRGSADAREIDLVVPAAQVDDVLRSLTVVDGGEAAISGVRMLPAEREDDVVLRVGLASAEGARDLRITYVTELPGWRPTYRLVAMPDRRVHLQGLAVIDNPTSEAWQDVALTLSTEVPLSFRFDLRSARAAHRPRFGPDGHLVRDEVAVAALAMPAYPRGVSEINEAYGMAQVDQPELSTRAGRRIDAPAEGAEAPMPVGPAAPGGALLAFEERPEGDHAGGVFERVEGFDLGRGESGLVPFVDTSTAGEMALVFKPSPGGALSQVHPYRSVLFENPSDAALLTGPVAIYSGDRFVGDGVTGAIPAHAHAFVPYAIERDVQVSQSALNVEDEVRATSLAGGVLTVELRAIHRERFVLAATRAVDERAYAFAAALDGYAPRALPEGTISTGQGYFLPVTIDAQGHGEVVLDLVRRTTASVQIASAPEHPYVAALLHLLGDAEEVARLRAIADRLELIRHELPSVEQDLAVERQALEERRAALDALRTVTSGGAIRARLAQAVERGVGHVDDLTRRATELRAEQIALGQEWYALLRALTPPG